MGHSTCMSLRPFPLPSLPSLTSYVPSLPALPYLPSLLPPFPPCPLVLIFHRSSPPPVLFVADMCLNSVRRRRTGISSDCSISGKTKCSPLLYGIDSLTYFSGKG
eukprot:766593-Hanusia_phi.AAC.5